MPPDADAILATLRPLLAMAFEAEASAIGARTRLRSLPGWSSLGFVVLQAGVEKHWGLTLAPADFLRARTAGALARRIAARLAGD